MIRISVTALLLAVALFSSACFRTSAVVKIKEDGSGEITSRYYFSPQVLETVNQMEALRGFQADGDVPELMANLGMLREIVSPDKDALVADAESYGEGVSYARHEKGADSEGWDGYTVVYQFEDIRKLKLNQNTIPAKAKDFVKASGQDIDLDEGGSLSFQLEGKKLTVTSTLASASADEMVDEEQLAAAKEMGIKPSESIRAAAASMEGMRAGIFLRIVPEIAETDAEHVTGNLIIMSDAELSKVMQDPDFIDFIDKIVEDPDAMTDESVKELFGKIEAMTIELSDEIMVMFP